MMTEGKEPPATEVRVLSPEGKQVGVARLPDELLTGDIPVSILKRVVVDRDVNLRLGTQAVQGRSDVSGGGRKPWRQKGTGRARQGTTRAPQWRGGGKALPPKPRSFEQHLNRRERRMAFRSALNLKHAAGRLLAVESLELPDGKTASRVQWLAKLGVEGEVVLVDQNLSEPVFRSTANLRHVRVVRADSLSAYDVLLADHIIISTGALQALNRGGSDGSA